MQPVEYVYTLWSHPYGTVNASNYIHTEGKMLRIDVCALSRLSDETIEKRVLYTENSQVEM